LGEVFQRITEAYEKEGYRDEWHHHHQGGPTGYQGRDVIVTPGCSETILSNMALAWNPSMPGVKSEDTIIVTDKGREVITRGEGWQYLSFDTVEGPVERPWPLVI
jgi:antitoxin VapB